MTCGQVSSSRFTSTVPALAALNCSPAATHAPAAISKTHGSHGQAKADQHQARYRPLSASAKAPVTASRMTAPG
jgi:hypothetical protein